MIFMADPFCNSAKRLKIAFCSVSNYLKAGTSNDIDIKLKSQCRLLTSILRKWPWPRRGCKGDPSGNGCGYTKAGIVLDDLIPQKEVPAMLFPPERPRNAKVMDALDAINDRFGKKTMVTAREGFDKKAWGTKADLRSPRYTTRITELPTVWV